MEEEIRFDQQLRHYLTMAIDVWPTLRSAAQHLTEVGQPHPNSFLPPRSYNSMTYQQFAATLACDLFDFIMEHDVKAEDIEDYLYDILELLMVEQELSGGNSNPASIQNMALYTVNVIAELQEGKKDRVTHFEQNVYNQVKLFQGQVVIPNKQEKTEGEGEGEEEDYDSSGYDSEEDEEEDEEGRKEDKKEEGQEQVKRREQQQKLQDDGWVIVRKKGR